MIMITINHYLFGELKGGSLLETGHFKHYGQGSISVSTVININ